MLKQLLLASATLLPIAANAADITVTPICRDPACMTSTTYVTIVGNIEPDDGNKFDEATKNPSGDVVVVLDSIGGSVTAGINIGLKIYQRHWNTIVDVKCNSTCALIWLAGSKRWAPENSLGFHAVFRKSDGQVSGAGNAIVGAYLDKLGFDLRTIYFLMHAEVNEIEWLSAAKARKYGIAIDSLQDTWIPYLGN